MPVQVNVRSTFLRDFQNTLKKGVMNLPNIFNNLYMQITVQAKLRFSLGQNHVSEFSTNSLLKTCTARIQFRLLSVSIAKSKLSILQQFNTVFHTLIISLFNQDSRIVLNLKLLANKKCL